MVDFLKPWWIRERFIDALFDETLPTFPVPSLTREALVEAIVCGGYPEALARPAAARRRAFFSAYLNSILSRDVRGIADIGALARLLVLLAGRVGGLVNAADLSRALEIPATTLKRYFGLVETTFLVQTLPAWSPSLGVGWSDRRSSTTATRGCSPIKPPRTRRLIQGGLLIVATVGMLGIGTIAALPLITRTLARVRCIPRAVCPGVCPAELDEGGMTGAETERPLRGGAAFPVLT